MIPERGLYVLTPPPGTLRRPLTELVAEALDGGARMLQYRDKDSDPRERLARAKALRALCRQAGALFLVNDEVELAARVGADGVHLGRDDPDPAAARARLGSGAVIGVSCYNCLDRAREAERAGADYLAFGRFFPSATKPEAVAADPALLRRARRVSSRPLVAIGGITPDNGASLIAAGADWLAVVQGVFAAPDARAAARAFTALFAEENSRS